MQRILHGCRSCGGGGGRGAEVQAIGFRNFVPIAKQQKKSTATTASGPDSWKEISTSWLEICWPYSNHVLRNTNPCIRLNFRLELVPSLPPVTRQCQLSCRPSIAAIGWNTKSLSPTKIHSQNFDLCSDFLQGQEPWIFCLSVVSDFHIITAKF